MVDIYLGQDAIVRGGALGVYDSDVRNAELEGEGIVAEVLFADFQNSNEPPWGAAFPFPDTTPELRLAGARAFNRWLADFCGQLPGRRAGVAVVQPHDIETAVGEVRWVREAGLASVMLPTGDWDLLGYHDPFFDPLWAACIEQDLPVTFHSGGTPWEGYGPHAMWVTKMEFMWWARRPLWQLVFGGVFERFPELRVAFTEQGADWIPSMLERMDEQYESPFERGITDHLSLSPSGYWNRNCYVGASFMSRAECDVRERIGVDRIMWGADYPHIEGTWPHSLGRAARGRQRVHARGGPADGERDRGRRLRLRPRRCSSRSRTGSARGSTTWSRPTTPAPATYSEADYALGKVSGMESGRRLMSSMLGGG